MANPFAGDPFGSTSPVQTTYQPPSTGAWGGPPAQADEEDIEPFTVAHLTAQDTVVPAVPVSSPGPARAAAPQLAFTGAGRQACRWMVLALAFLLGVHFAACRHV